jgi:hypothetical protein
MTRKPGKKRRALLRAYVWGRQTLEQLSEAHGKSHVWVKKQLDAAKISERKLVPQATPVAADMTFWGRSYGVCVFRSPTMKKNLWWTESQLETPWVYKEGLDKLLAEGWMVTSAVIDGKRGVAQVFEAKGIPVQYCQFHQAKTVTGYLTRKPKTEAARELRALALLLPRMTEEKLRDALSLWYERHSSFLDEKSPALNKKRGWDWTHRRIRAAHRSLKTNLGRLFTYQKYPDLHIPNTTNTLDGMFSQIKNRLAVHRGLRRERRYRIIGEILKGKDKNSN